MKGKDTIILSMQSWESDLGSNSFNIAREFAKTSRVLYINRAMDRNTQLKKLFAPASGSKLKPKTAYKPGEICNPEKNIFVLEPDVVLESINPLPSFLFKPLNMMNGRRFAASIQKAIDKLSFKDFVLFVDNDFLRGEHLPELLKPSCVIYYIRDLFNSQPYFRKHGLESESALASKADFVVANSSFLSEYISEFNSKSFDIGQGCDFSKFNPNGVYEIPRDLALINTPVIGYVGALVDFRLDIQLLEQLATRRTDWSFVLVGPEDEGFKNSSLHDKRNVFFLGRKHESELPAYVANFDVCINPQLINDMTKGNYPRKVDEYLVMGKPVVATRTAFMDFFLPFVRLAEGVDEYELAIANALEVDDDVKLSESRQQFALSHTWEKSVEKIYEAYDQTMKKTNNGKTNKK